jgi:hypothetical protein
MAAGRVLSFNIQSWAVECGKVFVILDLGTSKSEECRCEGRNAPAKMSRNSMSREVNSGEGMYGDAQYCRAATEATWFVR